MAVLGAEQAESFTLPDAGTQDDEGEAVGGELDGCVDPDEAGRGREKVMA